jgi:hypothetical protein
MCVHGVDRRILLGAEWHTQSERSRLSAAIDRRCNEEGTNKRERHGMHACESTTLTDRPAVVAYVSWQRHLDLLNAPVDPSAEETHHKGERAVAALGVASRTHRRQVANRDGTGRAGSIVYECGTWGRAGHARRTKLRLEPTTLSNRPRWPSKSAQLLEAFGAAASTRAFAELALVSSAASRTSFSELRTCSHSSIVRGGSPLLCRA